MILKDLGKSPSTEPKKNTTACENFRGVLKKISIEGNRDFLIHPMINRGLNINLHINEIFTYSYIRGTVMQGT